MSLAVPSIIINTHTLIPGAMNDTFHHPSTD